MNNNMIAWSAARGIRLFIAAALLALLTGLLAVSQPARADTIVVTKIIDNNVTGSLRWAINQANASPGADTITFDPELNGTITLAGTPGEDANAGGDLDILDAGDLTIQGNGAANTIIDGGGIDRVFHICPGGGCTGTVTISGMTIQNGRADFGGGIFNNAGTMTLAGSTVSANKANVGGGGIHNVTGTMTVYGSTISGNTADYGAGIANVATLSVQSGSTVSGNTAIYEGGGILNWTGTTMVDGSSVSDNTAALHGGGILNFDTLTVQHNSAVSGNTADKQGGGIYNSAGTSTVDGSTVSANKAQEGAGIYNKATLKVKNGSTIGRAGAGNQGIDNLPTGGGIYNLTSGTVTVDGSAVSANEGVYEGGGIYNRGTLTIKNGSVIGGAGAGNSANNLGGGIYNNSGATMTVDGSAVIANTAENFGGGIHNNGTLNVENSSAISANTSKSGAGIANWGTLIVTNSTIGGAGGGNNATKWGGGIYNYAGTTKVTGSCILFNWATLNGGGLYNDKDSDGAADVTGSSIIGNSDTSFFNNQAAEQIAKGNWWGASAGANKPGADTVDGNVDTEDPLTEPIPGCLFYVYLPVLLK